MILKQTRGLRVLICQCLCVPWVLSNTMELSMFLVCALSYLIWIIKFAKLCKSRIWYKVLEGSTVIFGDTKIFSLLADCRTPITLITFSENYRSFAVSRRYNTVWCKWKQTFMPKPSSFHPVISMATILAYDGQVERQTHDDGIYRASIASHGKN